MRILRSFLVTGGALAALQGEDYIKSLPFDVVFASPRSIFASLPSEPKCASNILDVLSECLGMDAPTIREGLEKFIKALTNEKVGYDEFVAVYQKKVAQRESVNHSAARVIYSANNRIAALAETLQSFAGELDRPHDGETCTDPSACALPRVQDGMGEIRLDYLPDLFLGFLSSHSISRILAGVIGQNTPAQWNVAFNIQSPMKNLGTSICHAADSAYTLDFDQDWGTCGIITLLALGLGCVDTPPDCSLIPTTPTGVDLTKCDRFTPSSGPVNLNLTYDGYGGNLNVTDKVRKAEGTAYLYRWVAAQIAFQWSSIQAFCGAPPLTNELVPGWPTLMEVWTNVQGSEAIQSAAVPGTIPQLNVAQKKHVDGEDPTACEFLLTLRGTSIAPEWTINFNAGQSALAGTTDNLLVHSGYNQLSAAILPPLSHWLDTNRFSNGQCDISKTTFHLTGHSLGGGMSELMALKLALRYQPLGATFDMVTFAASHALDRASTAELTRLVNTRSLLVELDAIPELPCVNKYGLPQCDNRICAGLGGKGRTQPFAAHPNPVPVTAEMLGSYSWPEVDDKGNPVLDDKGNPVIFHSASIYNNESFIEFDLLHKQGSIVVPSPLRLGPNHVCAYECYLTAEFCQTDASKSTSCNCPSA